MIKSKVIFIFIISIFTICLSCKNDNSVKEKELQAKIKELEFREKELIIKANKAEKILNDNLPLIKDDPTLEKQKIVIYAEEDADSLIFSKNELNKIEILFPVFKSEFISNPDEAYASCESKLYIDQYGKKEDISFSSEAGQDDFCLVYAYYLKQKNGEKKYRTERKNLIELYRAINGLYDGLEYGSTFYGHQHKRLNASVEYSIYILAYDKEYFEKKYDFHKQKGLYIKSLIQYVEDEESQNVYYQEDLISNKPKAIERAKRLKEKIDIIQKLITNYFYLNQVQDFEKNYR
jgi:hypothetical protein